MPLRLRIDALPAPLPESVEDGLAKAARRYRDGDLDGAMTAIVGLVDETTEAIWAAHSPHAELVEAALHAAALVIYSLSD